MANAWFRMYHEFATDPKVQMLSESYQRRYVMILCLRCCNDDVTLHDDEVAFQLRISNEDWLKTKAVFLDKGLIDDDNKPTAWDKRQFVSDTSKNRVAAYRDRKNKEISKIYELEEEAERSCNGDVTLQKRSSNGIDTDTDTDTDTEKNNVTASAETKPSMISAKRVADYLAKKILEHNSKAKPKPVGWIDEVEKSIRIDEKTESDLIEIIDWIYTEGTFWIPNIMSGKKLREKYDQMYMQKITSKQSAQHKQPVQQARPMRTI
jgi:hypothetical protein